MFVSHKSPHKAWWHVAYVQDHPHLSMRCGPGEGSPFHSSHMSRDSENLAHLIMLWCVTCVFIPINTQAFTIAQVTMKPTTLNPTSQMLT